MSSSSSSSSAAAVFPPSPQPQAQTPPPPLLVENLLPLNQLSPMAEPASEKLCYVHCHFCDTVLVVRDRIPRSLYFCSLIFDYGVTYMARVGLQVSVPTSSLFKTVTVRCGHCSSLLTVNMRALLFPGTPTNTAAAAIAPAAVTSTTTTTTTTRAITTPPAVPVISSVNNDNTAQHQFNFLNSLNLAPNPPHHHSILVRFFSSHHHVF
jgi:hypothetical protein